MTDENQGFISNCIIIPRDGETLFVQSRDGIITPRLDGYVILPIEEYKQLKGVQYDA